MQLSCHSVAVVLTLVQTKQIGVNIHKRNNTQTTVQTIQNTLNTSTHITNQVKTTTVQFHGTALSVCLCSRV